ncbi:Histidine ABC transporter [Klebsiella michiganensis]|uniref:Histidine ABC transporter n=1 Tax=Klebsiella michiganensis TaxID=1134687 RepID=A0A7H4PP31_9ENTR|nr:Histidine ABC transporter [Klebsiella michiganensis]
MPDLVLMLLIFYGLQIALNGVTDALGLAQFDIDPMVAGIITLGFIYGGLLHRNLSRRLPGGAQRDILKRRRPSALAVGKPFVVFCFRQ